MTRSRSRKPAKTAEATQQPTPPTQDDFAEVKENLDSDDPMEKNETEVELEKLVFGDDAGFLEGLRSHGQEVSQLDLGQLEESKDVDTDDVEDEGLEGIADADVKIESSTS